MRQAGGQRVAGESPLRSGSFDEEEADDEDILRPGRSAHPAGLGALRCHRIGCRIGWAGSVACHDAIARCLDALVEGLSFMEAVRAGAC